MNANLFIEKNFISLLYGTFDSCLVCKLICLRFVSRARFRIFIEAPTGLF